MQTIQFDNKLYRQLANFVVKIGTVQFLATLDTGSHTGAWMDAKRIAELKEAGTLHERAVGHYEISGMTIDGNPVAPMDLDIV